MLAFVAESFSVSVPVIAFAFALSAFCGVPPLTAVYALCGAVLPTRLAILAAISGGCFGFAFSYLLGYISGDDKSPLLMALSDDGKNGFFVSFILRAVRFLPCGSIGIYIGKSRLPFLGYLLGSAIGALPSVALSVSLGCKLSEGGVSALEFSSYLVALSTLKLFLVKLFVNKGV